MKYQGRYCAPIMNSHHLGVGLDYVVTQRNALTNYEHIPSASYLAPVRVLVAGDHATLRSSLKTMLELDPQISVVGEAADDCETVKMARRLKPDVLLIDLDMRCCDDFEAVAEISRQKLASAIVGLTIHDESAERTSAESAGVNLLLEKGVPYRQLISAIRSLAGNCNH